MENNRNLSSIISKIRDEGLPDRENAPPADPVSPAPDYTDEAIPGASAAQGKRRVARKLLLALSLVLIAGLVVYAGTYTGYRDDGAPAGAARDVRGWLAAMPGTGVAEEEVTGVDAAAPAVLDEALVRELWIRQRDIMARLDQLTDSMTVLSESVNKSLATNDTVIAGLRQEQQAGIESLESRVSELQRELVAKDEKPAAESAPRPAAPVKKTTANPKPAAADKAEPPMAGKEWVVNVAASSRKEAMTDLAAKLREKGIPVERVTLSIGGGLMYRLRVPGFATSGEARRYAERLDKDNDLRGAWVSHK